MNRVTISLIFLISSLTVVAQDFLNLSQIKEIFDAPINRKESRILNYGFELGTIQPTPGQKLYNKGLVVGSHFNESISFVTRITQYNDPVGFVSYQTWVPKHYSRLSEAVANSYRYIGNLEFSGSKGETFDLYQGNGFVIMVYSFSIGSNMVGNICFKPSK
jgi:hypothetical protein